ncbi:MAG: ferredoxin [Candidatus Aenigmarchaeota archaeon]|nr:ferredoxin [Candidatus Aenigmarchaeota archaeon]
MAVKIKQDHDACIGCGACASVCPDNWIMEKDGKHKPIETAPKGIGCNQEAADSCPVGCIEIVKA